FWNLVPFEMLHHPHHRLDLLRASDSTTVWLVVASCRLQVAVASYCCKLLLQVTVASYCCKLQVDSQLPVAGCKDGLRVESYALKGQGAGRLKAWNGVAGGKRTRATPGDDRARVPRTPEGSNVTALERINLVSQVSKL